ncbi:hypothetical protein JCM10296v2_000748 [Rhodotorula toruloides]
MTTVTTPSPPPVNRPTLLDLPQELLDTIVELAWPDLPKPGSLAPCRRLQPCFDWRRFATISMRGKNGMALYYALQARRAMGEHCRTLNIGSFEEDNMTGCSELFWALIFYWVPALERLDVFGLFSEHICTVMLGPNAQVSNCLPRLRHLGFPFNPWTAPNPFAQKCIAVLGYRSSLESLRLGGGSWATWAGVCSTANAAVPGAQSIPPLRLLERLTDFDACMFTDARTLGDLVRQMPRLGCLRLSSVPSPEAVNQCVDALPNSDVLTTLDISFRKDCMPTNPSEIGEAFVDDGIDGIRVVLAPIIRRLAGLTSLIIGDCCTCLDVSSKVALKACVPLRLLHFRQAGRDDLHFAPLDIQAFLKDLGDHAPHEVCCDHYEKGAVGGSLCDFPPVQPGADFPDFYYVYRDWILPDWFEGNEERDIRALVAYGKKAGVKITGSMVEGLQVKALWKEEEALYDHWQMEHEEAAGTDEEESDEEE